MKLEIPAQPFPKRFRGSPLAQVPGSNRFCFDHGSHGWARILAAIDGEHLRSSVKSVKSVVLPVRVHRVRQRWSLPAWRHRNPPLAADRTNLTRGESCGSNAKRRHAGPRASAPHGDGVPALPDAPGWALCQKPPYWICGRISASATADTISTTDSSSVLANTNARDGERRSPHVRIPA
jgi:hypothetical protein